MPGTPSGPVIRVSSTTPFGNHSEPYEPATSFPPYELALYTLAAAGHAALGINRKALVIRGRGSVVDPSKPYIKQRTRTFA